MMKKLKKKIQSNIKNIDIGSRMKDKEIDSSKINHDNNLTTVKRLPTTKGGIFGGNKNEKEKDKNKTKKKGDGKSPSPDKKKNKRHNRNGSGEYSGDEDDDDNGNGNGNGDVKLLKEKLVY